jgi:hypothetical protein
MNAYVIFDVEIHDLVRYQEFMKAVQPAVEAAVGKYLARGGAPRFTKGTGSQGESCFLSIRLLPDHGIKKKGKMGDSPEREKGVLPLKK